jgi:2-polyprenyl-6-methoxyphenol hydroxylase-like FAD-dependent oxidoreductase
MAPRTVLVSGAGIAGPVLAHWLRCHGFVPTVVERATQPRGGYKIDLRGAAVDVIDRMGLLDDVRAATAGMRVMSFVDAAGRRTASVPADLFMGRGESDVELMRGELSAIVAGATAGVEYLHGDTVTSVVERPDGVDVTFEKAPPRTFGLVVGADGLHSAVRRLAFGEEREFLHELGYGVAIHSAPNHLGLDREELLLAQPGRTVLAYSTAGSADAKAMYLFRAPHGVPRERAAQRAEIRARFDGAGWETGRLLAAMESAPDLYCDSISQVRMESWSRGRVVLVGDAAHAPSLASGQGTSLAVVGAYVLAAELAEAPGDHATAFAAYERRMRGFVEANQALGARAMGRMVASSRLQCRFGALAMRVLPSLPWQAAIIERMTRAVHAAATAVELPEPAPSARLG